MSGEQVEAVLPLVSDPVVQEYIEAPEITVGALLDLTGEVIHLVPRIRLKTVGENRSGSHHAGRADTPLAPRGSGGDLEPWWQGTGDDTGVSDARGAG